MNNNKCSHPRCNRLSICKDFCLYHYQESMKKLREFGVSKKPIKLCSIIGCNKINLSKGFCNAHYKKSKYIYKLHPHNGMRKSVVDKKQYQHDYYFKVTKIKRYEK